MPIIYSYPLVTPQDKDLILGVQVLDDEQNKTVTYSVQGLISMVDGALNTTYDFSSQTDGNNINLLLTGSDETTDTVKFMAGSNITLLRNSVDGSITIRGGESTSVSEVKTGNSFFISGSGGPITKNGTLTYNLSATGTPSVNTFLRGDNTWASIPVPEPSITSVVSGKGISVSNTGSVFQVANTGVTKVIGGNNISVSPSSGVGEVTINFTGSTGGVDTNTQYAADGGLKKLPISPTEPLERFAVETLGSNNYINAFAVEANPVAADFFSFNQLSSGNVKTVAFEDVTVDMLTSVKNYLETTYITEVPSEGFVKNTADNFGSIDKVKQVVTLTDAEYSALATKDPNTLYLTVSTAPTQYTITMTPLTNNIVGPSEGYTLSGDLQGATRTGAEGAAYQFTTTAAVASGYQFTTPFAATNPSGTIPANNTTEVEQILTGTVELIPTSVTATLNVDTSGISGGTQGSIWELTGDLNGATQSGNAPLSYSFTTGVNILDNTYEWTTGPTVSPTQPNAGTTNIDLTVNTVISGALNKKQGEATLVLTDSITGGSEGVEYSVSVNNSTTQTGDVGSTVSWTVTATPISGFSFSSGPNYIPSQTVTATLTETPQNVPLEITGAIEDTKIYQTLYSLTGNDIKAIENAGEYQFAYGTAFAFDVTNGEGVTTRLTYDRNNNYSSINKSVQANLAGAPYSFTVQDVILLPDLYWDLGPTYSNNPLVGNQIAGNYNFIAGVTGRLKDATYNPLKPFIVMAADSADQLPSSSPVIACQDGTSELYVGAYLNGDSTNNAYGASDDFALGDELFYDVSLRIPFTNIIALENLTPSNDDISGWWKVYTTRPAAPGSVFGAVRLKANFDENNNLVSVSIEEIRSGGCCFVDDQNQQICYTY